MKMMASGAAGTPICISSLEFRILVLNINLLSAFSMHIFVWGGPSVGFHALRRRVNVKSKENEPITYTFTKCVCVCVPFINCLNFPFVFVQMHVRMCLNKIKTGRKNERYICKRRERHRQRKGWRQREGEEAKEK